jgi:hypothetical protein
MGDSTPDSEPENALQFLRAEPGTAKSPAKPVGRACALCRTPIVSTYFALRDKVLCPTCHTRVTAPPPGSELGRFAIASLFGLGAGLLGAVIWFAVRRVAHIEIGIVAIVVGFLVGKAVRKGSGNRGGVGYQILAVGLTYFCVAANYVPDIVEAVVEVFHRHNATVTTGMIPSLAFFVVKQALETPFLRLPENLISLLIIGFALWEAWKLNQHRPLPITGPYQMSAGTTQAAAAAISAAKPPSATIPFD